MLNNKKIILIIPAHNEAKAISSIVRSVDKGLVDKILVIDDASTDDTKQKALCAGAEVIANNYRKGVGAAIRTGIEHAIRHNFEIVVVMAGNGKDNPEHIQRLLHPLVNEGYDFVQGSRYLKDSQHSNMPLYRVLGTKLYALFFSLLSGRKITDGTNGFRAFSIAVLKDKRINLWQTWLNGYELERYFYYKELKLGYLVKEVAVSKIYPLGSYTKMKPFIGWWSMLRPVLLLGLGVKK